jgi:indole-3-glycerol phosphate synthase / phosphoribosylanthranilate isomerase
MALEKILENKRQEVERRKQAAPLDTFRATLRPSKRRLRAALKKPRTGFIMECKKASPSKGLIRPDFDIKAIAGTYVRYADAISVLADETFFQGSLENVRTVSETVDLPVLCKDFTLEPYQVYEARRFGADAVLLMMSVLDDAMYRQCLEAVRALDMDALTEVHDETELERALAMGADIIGINNRNLKDLTINIETSRLLAPKVPEGAITVIESGISRHREVVELRALCHGFLVGSSLMSRSDLDRACRELVYGPVKVCGLTRPEDARAAFDAGASFGGLIFAEKSPRHVSLEQAKQVRDAAPLDWVGVFVNSPEMAVATLASRLRLKAVQLHGDETADYIDRLRPALPEGCEVWKSVSVAETKPEISGIKADRVLFDTGGASARGGTGRRFDWSLIAKMPLDKVVLAGGLDADTAEAADQLGAALLDVNSGVEQAPGVKDKTKLIRFFDRLRG